MDLISCHCQNMNIDISIRFITNTTIREIPSIIFSNLTFLTIQFEHNPYLSTIDPNAITNTNEHILIFETLNFLRIIDENCQSLEIFGSNNFSTISRIRWIEFNNQYCLVE